MSLRCYAYLKWRKVEDKLCNRLKRTVSRTTGGVMYSDVGVVYSDMGVCYIAIWACVVNYSINDVPDDNTIVKFTNYEISIIYCR